VAEADPLPETDARERQKPRGWSVPQNRRPGDIHDGPEARMSTRKPARAVAFEVTAEINVTPMIDVMLVLLIIFMVVTPAVTAAALPRARTAQHETGKHPTLVIDAQGRMSLDVDRRVERVGASALRARMAAVYAAHPSDHVLYLKADRNLDDSRVLSAIEDARAAGVTRVAAITEQPKRDRRR
jgi:biopolymer transport protein ExbD